MSEAEQRAAVVAEARTWIGTPYHHSARVRGVGVDCAQILIAVFAAAGVIEDFTPDAYPPDWMMHRSEERYVATIERFATEYDWRETPPLPGDVVAWRYGRCFSHGAIVSAWPRVIHAFAPFRFVDESDTSLVSDLTRLGDGSLRAMRAFSVWER